jgi:saccharopine dehydrogenase-like NADP-dependent oxidoreductase
MKILLLGMGMQGKAALHDLINSVDVAEIIVADRVIDHQLLQAYRTGKVSSVTLDVTDLDAVTEQLNKVDAVIYLLPKEYRMPVVRRAIELGVHYVDASYSDPKMAELSALAVEKNVAVLPESGFDPGIDLVLAKRALDRFEEVYRLDSYGAGIPDATAVDNPLKYKISWTFSGVLSAYKRPAFVVRNGVTVTIPPEKLFDEENVFPKEVERVGVLEAYPNGNAAVFLEKAGKQGAIRESGRYTMRWPGNAAIWKTLKALGFLDEKPVTSGGNQVTPFRFTHDLLAPQLQYAHDELDLAIVRVETTGRREGATRRYVQQVVDQRDLDTGLLAMQRTVGFTTSIVVQMILRGDIPGSGLLTPIKDIPTDPFIRELRKRRILVDSWEESVKD